MKVFKIRIKKEEGSSLRGTEFSITDPKASANATRPDHVLVDDYCRKNFGRTIAGNYCEVI